MSNSGAIANALILNGIAKVTGKKYIIDYQGEDYDFLGKPKFEEFIKSHLDYYKQKVEECGGIKLLPDSELPKPQVEEQDIGLEDTLDSSVIEDEIEELEEPDELLEAIERN